MNRRTFLASFSSALAFGETLPPVRAITRPPGFHWFGYYDKLQFDPSSRYALGCRGSFEHRLPTAEDKLQIGMVDLQDNDRWIDLGVANCWSWHQTCMLQWLPGSKDEIIWNDRQDGRFVAHILNVRTRKQRTVPSPVYCLHPNGRQALFTDFRRLYHVRPETGYAGVPDPNKDINAPEDAGIWTLDLGSGKSKLIIPIKQAYDIPNPHEGAKTAKHWFNHLLYAPGGKRFVFLHRWRPQGETRFQTRMFTANADGSDLRILDPHGRTSHFIWRDSKSLLVWTWLPSHGETFYIIEDGTGKAEPVAADVLTRNGHCTYLPGNRWILTDTAPDKDRLQHPYLFDTQSKRIVPLGHFHSPPEYTGVWRCDTTPRSSPDGNLVVFDSPHGGNGRQMYLADIRGLVR